jgi:toxin ParE1/3/4
MGLVRRTQLSLSDYDRIYDYIALDNEAAAEKLLRVLDAKLSLLSEMPGAGAARPDLGKDVRSLPVGNYLIIYRKIEGGVHLLRVIHGARNVKRVYRRGEP